MSMPLTTNLHSTVPLSTHLSYIGKIGCEYVSNISEEINAILRRSSQWQYMNELERKTKINVLLSAPVKACFHIHWMSYYFIMKTLSTQII